MSTNFSKTQNIKYQKTHAAGVARSMRTNVRKDRDTERERQDKVNGLFSNCSAKAPKINLKSISWKDVGIAQRKKRWRFFVKTVVNIQTL